MIFAWILLLGQLWASPKQKITLQDGSVILGELTNFDGQFYTFSTESLGEIQLPVEKVRSLNTYTDQDEQTSQIRQDSANNYSSSNHVYNDYNSSFSVQEAKEPQTPKSPTQPKEPLAPSTADIPYYPPGYQQPSSQENNVNPSLIYGMNKSVNSQSITDMQNMMMSDGEVLGMIIGLQNDPDMSAILNNPQIMLYMSTGNLEELQKIPELQRLMSKPEMQQLMQIMQR